MSIRYSIVVATRDNNGPLYNLLDSLSESLILTRKDLECIIIDNSDSGNEATHNLCQEFAVSYLFEGTRGKSNALNTGIWAAKGDYIAFTDDDVIVKDYDWVDHLSEGFGRSSKIGYVSGNITAFSQDTYAKKLWEQKGGLSKGEQELHFSREFQSRFKTRPWPLDKVCAGANCMIPRKLLLEIGGMEPNFGPGAVIGHGESLLIGYEIMRRGFELMYLPNAIVYHCHPPELESLKEKMHLYGVGDTAIHMYIFDRYHDFRSLFYALGGRQIHTACNLVKSILGQYKSPPELVMYSLKGTVAGPFEYILNRTKIKKHTSQRMVND